MNIFISHSSKNTNYGNALVDLLISVGINGGQIIFTSNDAHGIPLGQDIFTWLKDRINEKPHVLYLLSPDYYESVACLNEMGAAWVVENEHTIIFTPNFNLSSHEFQNGVLNPREMGFFIYNQVKLFEFIESLKKAFRISPTPVLVSQKINDFLLRINSFPPIENKPTTKLITLEKDMISADKVTTHPKPIQIIRNDNIEDLKKDGVSRFFSDFINGKAKDVEIILVHYIMETGKYKLGTGWQESYEIENVKAWEDVHELNNILSTNYTNVLRLFEMRKLTEVSDVTTGGKSKEVRIVEKMQEKLLDLPKEVSVKILEVVVKNKKKDIPF